LADKSIIIIGAGIAGLATGCYGQMNGYRTRIFEMHTQPGGLCTSWKRRGYTFDGCIHWLIGAGPGSGLHHVWEELGAVQGRPVVYHEEFVRFEGPDGKTFIVYTDIDRLARHMKTLSPADGATIDAYARAARTFTRFDLFALPVLKPWEVVRLLPFAGSLAKWGRVTMQDFAARFDDPFLRQVFPLIHDYPPLPMAAHLANLAGWHSHNAGWPVGGSLAFARAIERRHLDLGGEVHYKSRVEKILLEACPERGGGDDRAVGVRLADGTEHRADVVISAADGHATIFDMLEGKYTDDQIRDYYADPPASQQFGIHVSLGVARDLSNEPHAVTHLLEGPIAIAGEPREQLTVKHYGYDPNLAPPGKSAVKVMLDSTHAYWKNLYDDRERYEAEKEQVARAVIDQLEKPYPGISGQIEVVDVATLMTIERYTGNWQGLQAWPATRNTVSVMLKGLSKTLPGLKNFYMVGQWAGAMGGLPAMATSARKLIQTLCRRDRRRFVTSVPSSDRLCHTR
jgi:phytoene dehydrogenase-like protein